MDSYLCKQWHLRSHNGERPPSRLALGRRFEIDPRLVQHMHKMLTDNPNPVVRGIVNRYVGEFGAVPGILNPMLEEAVGPPGRCAAATSAEAGGRRRVRWFPTDPGRRTGTGRGWCRGARRALRDRRERRPRTVRPGGQDSGGAAQERSRRAIRATPRVRDAASRTRATASFGG